MRRFRSSVTSDTSVTMQEVKMLVRQAANAAINLNRKESFQEGYGLPSMSAVASFLNREVVDGKVQLPMVPIQIPWDMGVWEVTDSLTQETYIPLPAAVMSVMGSNMIDDIGIKGYRVRGDALYFSKNAQPEHVDIHMIVMGEYDDHDPFPLPADMEFDLISNVLRVLFSISPGKDVGPDSQDMPTGQRMIPNNNEQ